MARPSKLNPETHAAIVKSLAIGATRKDAAGAAGVVYTTFLDWMAAGEKATKGPFHEFYNACSKAEHTARLNFTSVIAKAAQEGDWRAALEYLKRRDPDNWRDNVDVTSGGEKIILTWPGTNKPDDKD